MSITIEEPDAGPLQSRSSRHSPYWVATVWGVGLGMLCSGVVVLLALPARPEESTGFQDLGWFIGTLIFAAAGALVGVAVGTWWGLSRGRHPSPVLTGLLVVPTAILLAVPTAGLGALAAPAVAVWLARGLNARGSGAPARALGLGQRLVMTVAACAVVVLLVTDQLEGATGPTSKLVFWGALLIVVAVGAPVGLLRPVLPAGLVAAFVVATVASGVGAYALDRHAGSKPKVSVDELVALVGDVGRPGGTVDAHRVVGYLPNQTGPAPLPVVVVLAADDRAASAETLLLPPALTPGPGGYLPASLGESAVGLPSGERGRRIAADWEQSLRQHGWTAETGPGYVPPQPPFWLPEPAGDLVEGAWVHTFSHGTWVRAAVVPHGDGALLIAGVRR